MRHFPFLLYWIVEFCILVFVRKSGDMDTPMSLHAPITRIDFPLLLFLVADDYVGTAGWTYEFGMFFCERFDVTDIFVGDNLIDGD